MRTILFVVLWVALTAGYATAGLFHDDKIEKLQNSKEITVIIPNSPGVTDTHYSKLSFNLRKLGTQRSSMININGSNITKREFIQVKKKIKDGVEIEKRIDDGNAGSGMIYYVRCSQFRTPESTTLVFKPYQTKSYQQGLISFDVPEFSEDELDKYIIHHAISYKMEIDSNYSGEAVNANFMRLAAKAGEDYNQPTGRIIKNNFTIPYSGGKANIAVELFPYKNGSKAVIQGVVPGHLTSEGTVDFNVILKDIKAKIESIVNS